jgi:hypothetical protein
MKQKILFVWVLLLSFATAGFAEDLNGTCGSNLTWTLSDGTLTISGTGEMHDYSTSIPIWYRYLTSIEAVIIEDGVTSIGEEAFHSCNNLTSVTIGNSVADIGSYAFYGCSSLGLITIPDNVTSIGNGAFAYCSSLGSITIPDNVTSIGVGAFIDCASLTAIDVSANNVTYASENEVLFNKTKTSLLQYPIGKPDANYTIPNSVTDIGYSAFAYCSSLNSIMIPGSVTNIGEYAFAWCYELTSVEIPNSVESIGQRVFYECRNLISVTIGENVTNIGSDAFNSCTALTSVTNLNPEPQQINSYAFYNVDIEHATLYVPAESVEAYKAAVGWFFFGTITEYIPSAINAPSAAKDLHVWISGGELWIENAALKEGDTVQIFNIAGRKAIESKQRNGQSIAVSHLPKGVYIVRIGNQAGKFVKE